MGGQEREKMSESLSVTITGMQRRISIRDLIAGRDRDEAARVLLARWSGGDGRAVRARRILEERDPSLAPRV
jgi:hypothetical protein